MFTIAAYLNKRGRDNSLASLVTGKLLSAIITLNLNQVFQKS